MEEVYRQTFASGEVSLRSNLINQGRPGVSGINIEINIKDDGWHVVSTKKGGCSEVNDFKILKLRIDKYRNILELQEYLEWILEKINEAISDFKQGLG